MAHSIDDTLAEIRAARACAILRASDTAVAAGALDAAVRGGFRCLEVTMNTPGALDHIARLAADSRLTIGAGTVLTVEQARACAAAGARFLVSPVTAPAVIAEAARLGCVAIPGAHTPTELYAAHQAGAPLQKLFPAPHGGPEWLRAVLAPLPMLRVVPTHGVDEHNAAAWLGAGAFAVGMVRSLFSADDLAARAWDRIEARARTMLAAVGAPS